MLEQDAVHIGCEADLAAHVLDVQGRQLSVKGLLDTGAVVSVMPVKTWTDMGFDRSDLIPTNIRLPAANQGAIYVTGRTSVISLQLGGRHLWMSNTEATTVTTRRGMKLGHKLPLNTDFQSVESLKKFDVTKCPLHANQECILKKVNEMKSSRKLFSMKSETDMDCLVV